jgi:hypothetical protein
MQRLDLMGVPSALTFIEDRSPKKEGHPKYVQIVVAVCAGAGTRSEVRPIEGQGFDAAAAVRGCPKEVSTSPVGTRFRLAVRRAENGGLSSFHSWPYERLA